MNTVAIVIAVAVVLLFVFSRGDRARHDMAGHGPPPSQQAIHEAIKAGRTIEAIKLYREAHGVGLAEAKEAVDALERDHR